MKKIALYIFVFLFWSNYFNSANAIITKYNGQGDLELAKKIIEEYYSYITTGAQNNPLNFFITQDHKNTFVVINKNTNYKGYSGSGPIGRNKKKCESKYKQPCFLFSNQRFIVWNNGINPIKKENSFLKRKISFNELHSKLVELGFKENKEQKLAEEQEIIESENDVWKKAGVETINEKSEEVFVETNEKTDKIPQSQNSSMNVSEFEKKELFDPSNITALIDKSKEDFGETAGLEAQIFGCWSVPLGLPYNENLLVRIKLKLRPDGSIIKTEIVDHERMNQPGQEGHYKALVESALRAIQLCQPLKVPTSGYERWKDLQLNFDVREMLGG